MTWKRSFLEKLYRSPLSMIMSSVGNFFAFFQKPFMVYGYFDHGSRSFRKYTRMSSTVTIMNRKALSVSDHVWVWHNSILDATEGLSIDEGCQIGAWVGIFTHGSENAIRLLGSSFVNIHNTERVGYTRGSVHIGAYTFVAAGSIILPGVNIGKGCIIGAGSMVNSDVPDYSIVVGMPGKVMGSTLDIDQSFFKEFDFSHSYYDKDALRIIKDSLQEISD